MTAIVVRLPAHPHPTTWMTATQVQNCPHTDYETVFYEDLPGHFKEADRCTTCKAPRCSWRSRNGECHLLRNHTTPHLLTNGEYETRGTWSG